MTKRIYENKVLKQQIRYLPINNTFVLKIEHFWGKNIKNHFAKMLDDIQAQIKNDGLLVIPIKNIEMDYLYVYRQYFYVVDIKDYDLYEISKVYDSYERRWYEIPPLSSEKNFRLVCNKKKE